MQHNGSMSHADAVALGGHAKQCRMCASSASSSLVDAYGTAICDLCLRRINADPREKRRFMFSMSDAAYW
jgi:hypothetical protein